MPTKPSARIQDHFARLTDPRRRKVVYPLINIVTIAICAVICGADDFVAIAKFGRAKRKWLSRFLDLSAGIPSHDRFNAIFAAIKPAEFEACLLSWITALHELTGGQIVAIAGKTLRRSFDRATSKSAIHMISAWVTVHTPGSNDGAVWPARYWRRAGSRGVGAPRRVELERSECWRWTRSRRRASARGAQGRERPNLRGSTTKRPRPEGGHRPAG